MRLRPSVSYKAPVEMCDRGENRSRVKWKLREDFQSETNASFILPGLNDKKRLDQDFKYTTHSIHALWLGAHDDIRAISLSADTGLQYLDGRTGFDVFIVPQKSGTFRQC